MASMTATVARLLAAMGWTSATRYAPESVVIDVTELAAVWLPHNREPWSAAPAQKPTVSAVPAAQLCAPGEPAGQPAAGQDSREETKGGKSLPEPFGSMLAPYEARCRTQQVWELLERAAAALVEHGDGPSLVLERGGAERETKDLYSIKDSLGRVTLREHTAHVVAAMIELVREQYRDHDSHMPRAVLAAMAHDLGKIPVWRDVKAYGKQDHAAISAMKLREWAPADPEPWWLESVTAAVRDHHRRSPDLLTALLRQADLRAREREVAAMTGHLTVAAFPAWMDEARWRELVRAEIDMLQKGNQWLALTHHGVVYAKIELLLRAARTVMTDRKAVDLVFLADGERERASAKLIKWCKEQGWLADEIGDGYYGLPYDVELTVPHRAPAVLPPHYLVPLKVEVFGQEGVFRQRKAGVLALVTAVRKRPLKMAPA